MINLIIPYSDYTLSDSTGMETRSHKSMTGRDGRLQNVVSSLTLKAPSLLLNLNMQLIVE